MTRHAMWAIAFAVAACWPAERAVAQNYPKKPVRFVVPFSPGGGNDLIARLIGGKLSDKWSQQVVVDNRGGAGGNIGAEIAAKSTPDGYTIFLFNSANAIAPSLYRRIPFDPVRDFDPVILIATSPFVLVVHPALPAKSVKELIALAAKKPGGLNYASGGNGSSTHLSAVKFASMAGIKMLHVPYKGAGPAFLDLAAGRVNMYFSSIPPALSQIKAGWVRALGVTSTKPIPQLPDVPTIASSGVSGYQSEVSYGIVVPAHTPASITKRLNASIQNVLDEPAVRSRLETMGLNVIGGDIASYGRYMKDEIAQWAKVVKDSGARID